MLSLTVSIKSEHYNLCKGRNHGSTVVSNEVASKCTHKLFPYKLLLSGKNHRHTPNGSTDCLCATCVRGLN